METINNFTSTTEDIRDAIKGSWGTEIYPNVKISYLGKIIIANGNLNDIRQKCSKDIYEWNEIGENVYVAWIKQ